MHFAKESEPASSAVIPVETAVKTPAEGLTLMSVLLRTDLDDSSFFSIAVILYTENAENTDSRLIRNITSDPKQASEIFRKIADGTVTPCTVSDVLEDLL